MIFNESAVNFLQAAAFSSRLDRENLDNERGQFIVSSNGERIWVNQAPVITRGRNALFECGVRYHFSVNFITIKEFTGFVFLHTHTYSVYTVRAFVPGYVLDQI